MPTLSSPLALDHVQLLMPADAEQMARAFWCDLLGLIEIPKPLTLAGRGGVWFQLSDVRQLHCAVVPNFQPATKSHPAFTTPALDVLAAYLTAAGHPVHWDDELAPRRRFYTSDPFGNRLEFLEPAV